MTASQSQTLATNELKRDPRRIASLSKLAEDHVNVCSGGRSCCCVKQ